MKYVARLAIIDAEKNAEYRPLHLEYIGELYRRGKIVMAGPFTDKTGGLVIYDVDSLEEALRLVEQDPVVRSGARTATVQEWTVLDLEAL